MLVLTRKPNEQLVIGDQVRITVLGVRGNRIQLGIEAPPGVPIVRSELLATEFAAAESMPLELLATADW